MAKSASEVASDPGNVVNAPSMPVADLEASCRKLAQAPSVARMLAELLLPDKRRAHLRAECVASHQALASQLMTNGELDLFKARNLENLRGSVAEVFVLNVSAGLTRLDHLKEKVKQSDQRSNQEQAPAAAEPLPPAAAVNGHSLLDRLRYLRYLLGGKEINTSAGSIQPMRGALRHSRREDLALNEELREAAELRTLAQIWLPIFDPKITPDPAVRATNFVHHFLSESTVVDMLKSVGQPSFRELVLRRGASG